MVLFCDGAARGNQNSNAIAGCGWIIKDNGKKMFSGYEYLGVGKTNNEAEYLGLINGLSFAIANNADVKVVCMDSNLVVQQINGKFQVKASNLKPLYLKAKELIGKIGATIIHIPREKNSEADALANYAIDNR